MIDGKLIESLRLATEAKRDKYILNPEERVKVRSIIKEYMTEPAFKKHNESMQQKLLASACEMIVRSGVPEEKAVTFISNLHGRVSGTKGFSESLINEALGGK